MTIIDKLKQSVEASSGLQFLYDSDGTLNTRLDRAHFPCAICGLAGSSVIEDKVGVFHEKISVTVIFVNLAQFDPDGLQNEVTIDGCKRYALKWLTDLRTNTELRLVSVSNAGRYYNTNDANLTGYGVTVSLEEVDGTSSCA